MSKMKPDKSLTQRILKGSFTVILFASFGPPLGYLIKMVYSRSLSIEMFGLFYAMLAFFALLASFTDLGFGYCLTYLVPKYFKKGNYKISWNLYKYNQIISFATSLIISVFVALYAGWLSDHYFKVPEAKALIYVFIVFLIGGSLSNAIEKFFIGLQQEKYYATIQPVKMILTLIFSVIIWFTNNSNVLLYSAAWAVSTVIATLVFTLLLKRKYGDLTSKTVWDKKLFRLMFKYALPSFLTTFVLAFIGSINVIFLTSLKGVREVGIYEIVIPLASMSSLIFSPINTFLSPLISHLMEGEKEKVQLLLETALKIIPFVGFYFALFIFLFPSQPINFLFGEKWVGLAKSPLMVLSIGIIIAQTANFLATIVIGIGKVNERLRASIIIALINIILTYLLILKYSVLGATISGSIIFTVSVFLYSRIISKSIRFKFPVLFYLELLIVGIAVYFLVAIFNIYPVNLPQYLLTGVVYTSLMVGLAYFLKLFDKSMLKSLLET